ncbi:hypothetical protein B0O99DRAFT_609082 [Bisporella sp. PMI_857]|nr:hypothetical protein B0O99DRAFT_609082 [Bisporella sp. PMI_857]
MLARFDDIEASSSEIDGYEVQGGIFRETLSGKGGFRLPDNHPDVAYIWKAGENV